MDAAINAVREALASGLDWRELGQMIKAERRAGNPVAGLIDSLALDKNKITVVLENSLDEEEADDEAMTRPATKVGQYRHPLPPGCLWVQAPVTMPYIYIWHRLSFSTNTAVARVVSLTSCSSTLVI